MKHKLWKIAIVFVILSILTLLILKHITNSNQTITFMISQKNYSLLLTNSHQTFDIQVNVSKKNTMYTNKSTVESISIMNHNESNVMQVELIDMIKHENHVLIDTIRYYTYTMILKSNLEYNGTLDIIQFEDASIRIQYQNGEVVKLFVGNVSMTKIDKLGTLNQVGNDIRITNLKGIVNQMNDINTLVGIEMEVSKTSESNILIKHIGIIHNNIGVNYNLILTDYPIDNPNIPAQDVFGSSYYIFDSGEKTTFDYILNTSTIRFTIPLYYEDAVTFENELAFYLIYEIDHTTKYYVYGSFCFFNTSNRIHDWIKYSYERN